MDDSDDSETVDRWLEFYRTYCADEISQLAAGPDESNALTVPWDDLYRFEADMGHHLLDDPEAALAAAEEALRRYEPLADAGVDDARVRPCNLPEQATVAPQGCRAGHFGRLITVTGTVTSAGTPEARPSEVAFECQSCNAIARVPVDQTRTVQMTTPPEACPECDDDATFEPRPEKDTHVEYQEAIIEGPTHGGDEEAETLLVTARDGLVGGFHIGQHVAITGILRHEPGEEDNHGSLSDRYLSAVHIHERRATQYVDQPRTPVDGDAVSVPEAKATIAEAVGCDPVGEMPSDGVMEVLEGSLAPSVPGLDTLRRAVLLQLAGGVPKRLPDDSRIRGDIHVLSVGPPGVLANRLLDAAARIAPYAVETDASESTSAGIGGAATRQDAGGGWRIRGGPLTNADDGFLTIRNLSGGDSDLLRTVATALEDQELTVTKGDANQKLPARTAVLASAEPKYGRWDEYESISEQIDLPPSLISAFDLIFTYSDEPDELEDRKRARSLLAANRAAEPEGAEAADGDETTSPADQSVVPNVGADTLRQYLAHVNETYTPTMSEGAKDHIEQFYVDLRSQGVEEDAPAPVSQQKLEALVRLAEAAARLRCSETVSEGDARFVTELVSDSLADLGMEPETNEFDADMIEAGHSKSQRDRIKGIKAIVSELENEYDEGAPYDEVVEMAVENGTDREKAEHEIEKLKQRAEIYEPSEDRLRTT
jgi:replicative DNA helicase Mcm